LSQYTHNIGSIRNYIQQIYIDGLQVSNYFNSNEIEELVANIGLFKFKGYVRAYKNSMQNHSIDEVLIVYFFDKYLTRIVMDKTSSIETKLKTILVELCYKQIKNLPANHSQKNNPFFYLIQDNYKLVQKPNGQTAHFSLNYSAVANWKNIQINPNLAESYLHYGLYYRNTYDFNTNQQHFLNAQTLMKTHDDINYPPFHYLIESATLGTVIMMVKYLKIGNFDLLQKVAVKFGVANTNVDFEPYLDRLAEIRNRAAHGERIFNRSYRSINRIGHFSNISQGLGSHKFIDVYLFLHFMLDRIDKFNNSDEFKNDGIKRLFMNFKKDYFISNDSKMLSKKIKRNEYKKIFGFILRGME
jgi:abortive infection bacteriophage resistance protein